MNLPDDCYELTTLRKYRDTYLAKAPCGQCDINEYYFIAPVIVGKINALADAKTIWKKVYDELVIPCVELIEKEKNEEARKHYKEYTYMLKSRYMEEY